MIALTKIFNMLKGQGVKRILKVTIRDNQKEPCSDRIIQQCLSPFDVRYLDWNKPDLNAGTIYASCPRIAQLTLYSSGRKAVLDSWVASTGLCRLRQVCLSYLLKTLSNGFFPQSENPCGCISFFESANNFANSFTVNPSEFESGSGEFFIDLI
jgi:hypothetical protein